MRYFRQMATLALAGSLMGCATVITGTTQEVEIDSQPSGATCNVNRGGIQVGTVQTPGYVRVRKGAADLSVSCAKAGYQPSQGYSVAGVDGWIFGNVVIGGIIGVIIDFTSGAAYHYDDGVGVSLASRSPAAVPYVSAYSSEVPSDRPAETWRQTADAGPRTGVRVIPNSSPSGDVTYVWGGSPSP